MQVNRFWTVAVELFVVLVVLSLIAGHLLGQPILLGYVETGSMEPQLEPGDGFVAIPSAIAGDVERGDVVVFEAQEIEGGGLTTHRVVGETDRGYITQGDANAITDQNHGEPPVQDVQVVAVLFQVNGEILAIPELGTAVEAVRDTLSSVQFAIASALGISSLLGPQGFAYLVFLGTLVYYAVSVYREQDTKDRTRTRTRETGTSGRLLAAAFTVLLVTSATAAMVAPAGPHEYGIISAEYDSDRPDVIPNGETESLDYTVPNSGYLPVVTFHEPQSDKIDVQPRDVYVGPRSEVNATLTLKAPPDTGYYRLYVVEHRYFAVLPQPLIRGLYELHPWAPIVVIDALIAVPFYLVAAILLGKGRMRQRSRNRDRSAVTRVRRAVRSLYR